MFVITAVLLVFSVVAQVFQHVCRKEYDKRGSGQNWCFSFVGVFTTLVYFALMSGGKFSVTKQTLAYAIPFSLCYTIAYICTAFAIKYGPMSLTSLIISCSVSVPVLYGVLALNEPLTPILLVGFVMLFLAMIFVVEPQKKDDTGISFKWCVYVGSVFLANGTCVTVQKLFQMTDKGAHSNEFMICSLALTLCTILIFVLLYEAKYIRNFIKKDVVWPGLCGLANGIANQLTMMLAIALPASFLYPVTSAGAILLTALVSVFIYREKLSAIQKIGFVSGMLAIVMFNI